MIIIGLNSLVGLQVVDILPIYTNKILYTDDRTYNIKYTLL